MSRPDYIRPAGQWPSPLVPTARDARELDQRISELVHSDGGTWVPVDPIALGGANFELVDSYLEGGLTVRRGGALRSAQTLPIYSPPTRTRSVLVPLVPFRPGAVLGTNIGVYDPGLRATRASDVIQISIPGRYMHRGATLLRATAKIRVPQRPTTMPSFPLSFGLSGLPLGARWKASTLYQQRDFVYPTVDNGRAYVAIGSGTTSGVEPIWPLVIGTTVVDGGVTWECESFGQGPYNVFGGIWTASTAKTVGLLQSVFPTVSNGYVYNPIVSGTTGASEPSWPLTVGATIVDGTVTWRNAGNLPLQQATTVDELYANGAAQTLAHTPYGFVIQENRQYVVTFFNAGFTNSRNYVFHSLKLEFSDIADARFA